MRKLSAAAPLQAGEEPGRLSEEFSTLGLMPVKPGVLLHACCGPCSTSCVERLADDYALTVFYYNPNITDREEYYLRRDTLLHFLDAFNDEHKDMYTVGYIEGAYEPDRFIIKASPLADEPEGGRLGNVRKSPLLRKLAAFLGFLAVLLVLLGLRIEDVR